MDERVAKAGNSRVLNFHSVYAKRGFQIDIQLYGVIEAKGCLHYSDRMIQATVLLCIGTERTETRKHLGFHVYLNYSCTILV